ncbi:MAG: hypothetical protein Q8M29_11615 [Bacteroidota bacterium]|nr:hypothetical protein [Bacteroidota bacterium]
MIFLREYRKYLLTAFLYYFTAFSLLFIVLYSTGKLNIFSNTSFLNWDAAHYFSVKEHGYDPVNTAFFPLFPFFWKLVKLSPIGIGFLNFSLFLAAISLLCTEMKLKLTHTLLVLSVPGLFFMFLPYAEALFFVSGTIAIVGLKRDRLWLTVVGLFLCSLCRPTTFIFIPAIVIVYYFSVGQNEAKVPIPARLGHSGGAIGRKKFFVNSAISAFVLVAGLMLSFFIQKVGTGQWFTFFDSQEKWGNKFGIPILPLHTWGGDNIKRYESSAFLIGVVCAVMLILLLFNKRLREKFNFPKYVVFSFAYLAGATGVVLLYRGGLLFSLNRFIYATPFVIVALAYFIAKFSFTIKQSVIFFFGYIIFSTLFASYSHIHNLLCFAIVGLILSGVLLLTNKNKYISLIATIVLILVNNVIAYHLISRFLTGFWVA